MPLIGLETERVSPPHEPETWFVLRTALSPWECEKARQQLGFQTMGNMVEAVGSDGFQGIMDALDRGESAEAIVARANERLLPPGDGVEVGDVADLEDEGPEVEVGDVADLGDGEPEDEVPLRERYDLDAAAKRLIKAWSYRGERGKKVKVTVEHIRMLDRRTREWLHDRVWAAMQPSLATDERLGE